ncbi:MAG: hypothetical protein H0V16_01475 [Burkholderiaceae bacterium]|nr:hypothetical protein [Burkholderiaceae bacterium]
MSNELILQLITATYALCNAARLLSYVPQIIAVARESSGVVLLTVLKRRRYGWIRALGQNVISASSGLTSSAQQ